MLAHNRAEEEDIAAVETIAGYVGHVNYDAIPGVIYTFLSRYLDRQFSLTRDTKRNIWPPCTWICKNGRLSNHQKCNKEWFRAIHLLSMSAGHDDTDQKARFLEGAI
eukprot:scaffold46894_cov35-Cyclotella_meneghiniana.AAC.1